MNPSLLVFYQDRDIFDSVSLPADWTLVNEKIDELVIATVEKDVRKAYGDKSLVVECIACNGEVSETMTIEQVAQLGAFFVVQPSNPKQSVTIHDLEKLKSLYKKALVVHGKEKEELEAKWKAKVKKLEAEHAEQSKMLEEAAKEASAAASAAAAAASAASTSQSPKKAPKSPGKSSAPSSSTTDAAAAAAGGGASGVELERLRKINDTLQEGVNARGMQIKKLRDELQELTLDCNAKTEELAEREAEVERLKTMMGGAMTKVLSYWSDAIKMEGERLGELAEKLKKVAPSHKKKIGSVVAAEQKHLAGVLQAFVVAAEAAAKAAADGDDDGEYSYEEESEEEEGNGEDDDEGQAKSTTKQAKAAVKKDKKKKKGGGDDDDDADDDDDDDDDDDAGGVTAAEQQAAISGASVIKTAAASSKPAVKVEKSPYLTLRPRSAMQAQFPHDLMKVTEKMATIWHKEMKATAVYKDLCRLARRITLYVDERAVVGGGDDDDDASKSPPLVVLSQIIGEVARRLETKKRAKKIVEAANKFAATTDATGRPEAALQALFETTIGIDSRTATVFRCMHQGLIMPTTFWLKSSTVILSKDVPSADGWRIEVHIKSNAAAPRVLVQHFRKEQSLSQDDNQRFVIEYRLRFFLDEAGTDLLRSDSRFVSVDFNQQEVATEVAAALRLLEQWNDALGDDEAFY